MLTCFIGSVAHPAEVFCSDMMGWVSFWVSCDDDPGEQNLLLSCRGATDQTWRTVEVPSKASHVSLAETKLQLSNVSQIIWKIVEKAKQKWQLWHKRSTLVGSEHSNMTGDLFLCWSLTLDSDATCYRKWVFSSKDSPNWLWKTIKEHQTVVEAIGQTQPGRRRVLRFDGAEADSCGRLNSPLDNTSGWPRRPLRHDWVTWSSLWRPLSGQAETDAALEAALGGNWCPVDDPDEQWRCIQAGVALQRGPGGPQIRHGHTHCCGLSNSRKVSRGFNPGRIKTWRPPPFQRDASKPSVLVG